jgi:hypothetical protein
MTDFMGFFALVQRRRDMAERRDIIQSREQMKKKIRSLVEDILASLPQAELARIAFSIQYWHDDDCPQGDFYIPAPPRDNATTAIQERDVSDDMAGAERLRKWRDKVRSSLEQKSKDALLAVMNDEMDAMSYRSLHHLSQSLLVLQRRKS